MKTKSGRGQIVCKETNLEGVECSETTQGGPRWTWRMTVKRRRLCRIHAMRRPKPVFDNLSYLISVGPVIHQHLSCWPMCETRSSGRTCTWHTLLLKAIWLNTPANCA